MSALLPVACRSGETGTPEEATKVVLESRAESAWVTLSAPRLDSAVGYRDGARTRARFVLRTGDGVLQVDLLTEQTPAPELVRGVWEARAPGTVSSGSVRAEGLHFLGGQGGRPSLGGRLVLVDSTQGDTLRLAIPPSELEPVRPDDLGPIAGGDGDRNTMR